MEPFEKRNHVGERITTKKTAIHPVICGWEEIRLARSILVPGRNLFLKSHHEGNMIAFNYPMTSAAMIKECGADGCTYVSGFSVMIPSPDFPGPWMDSIAVE